MLLIRQHISKNARDPFLQTFQHIFSWYIPSRSLRSASERRLMVPSQRGAKSLSRTFPPPSGGMLDPWLFSSDTWKHISSVITSLDFILKKKNPSLSFLTFGLLPLTSHCPARIFPEQCLEIYITSTSCVCLPFYNVSLIAFLNCKSLWIKASAKWINVNVHKITMYYSTAPGT